MPFVKPECRILAVATLYKQSPTESQALSSFFAILHQHPQMCGHFSVVIYDNSPNDQAVTPSENIDYMHDPSNQGLAAAYNYALERARESGCTWLLLLDQDTTVTLEFLTELIACARSLEDLNRVAAIVPKLVAAGTVHSPAEHFIDYIRHQFKRSLKTLDGEVGLQPRRVSAYNSGATLSVPVLESIGGFPKEYWLDYLDHAVFDTLSTAGYQVYVLHARLEHQLAESDINNRPLWRFRNGLRAQSLFVKRAGNRIDRLLYRIWLLRGVRRLRADCRDKRIWKETALQALFFNAPDSARPPASQYTQEGR
jgi:GT2 family glycosyltransferase